MTPRHDTATKTKRRKSKPTRAHNEPPSIASRMRIVGSRRITDAAMDMLIDIVIEYIEEKEGRA